MLTPAHVSVTGVLFSSLAGSEESSDPNHRRAFHRSKDEEGTFKSQTTTCPDDVALSRLLLSMLTPNKSNKRVALARVLGF